MPKTVLFLLMIMFILKSAEADVLLKQLSTGKVIEAHSDARPGKLIENGVANGYSRTDLVEVVLTAAEAMKALTDMDWGNDLAVAKARRIKEIRIEARKILSEATDWYVVRKYETGVAIPAPVTTYRASVRQTAQDSATAINAMSAIDSVRDYKPVWPTAPGE